MLLGSLFNHRLRAMCDLLVKFGHLSAYLFEEIILSDEEELPVAGKLVLFPLFQRVDNADDRYVLVGFL